MRLLQYPVPIRPDAVNHLLFHTQNSRTSPSLKVPLPPEVRIVIPHAGESRLLGSGKIRRVNHAIGEQLPRPAFGRWERILLTPSQDGLRAIGTTLLVEIRQRNRII